MTNIVFLKVVHAQVRPRFLQKKFPIETRKLQLRLANAISPGNIPVNGMLDSQFLTNYDHRYHRLVPVVVKLSLYDDRLVADPPG
jgi:hypothetical protein